MKNFLHNISQKAKSSLAWLWQKTKIAVQFTIKLLITIWKAILRLWFKIIYEEYELTVWYLKDSVRDKDGNITTTRSHKRYLLKKISKKTPNHLQPYTSFQSADLNTCQSILSISIFRYCCESCFFRLSKRVFHNRLFIVPFPKAIILWEKLRCLPRVRLFLVWLFFRLRLRFLKHYFFSLN